MALFDGRKRIFLLSATANYGSNVVSILTGMMSVPIGLSYFGPVRYGIFALITSIVSYLGVSSLGVGTAGGILTAKAVRPDEQRSVLQYSFIFISASSIVVLLALIAGTQFFPGWVEPILGKIPPDLRQETSSAAVAAAVFFVLSLPLNIFAAGFIGFQQFYWERAYASLSMVVNLLALIYTVHSRGDLLQLSVYRGLAILAISLISGVHFLMSHKELLHTSSEAVREEYRGASIAKSGIRFFSLSITGLIIWNVDNLVISHLLGPDQVTPYSITLKIFSILFGVFAAINSSLFPMYGKAAGLEQWDWIKDTYKSFTQLMPIAGGLVWIGGIAFARQVIEIWAGPSAYAGLWVVFALGGYGYLLSLINIHSFLLTGLNATKHLVYIGWAEATAKFAITVLLVKYIGIAGAAFGSFLGSLTTCFWMLPMDIYMKTDKKVRFKYDVILRHALVVLLPAVAAAMLCQELVTSEVVRTALGIVIVAAYSLLSYSFVPEKFRVLVKDRIRILRGYAPAGANDEH